VSNERRKRPAKYRTALLDLVSNIVDGIKILLNYGVECQFARILDHSGFYPCFVRRTAGPPFRLRNATRSSADMIDLLAHQTSDTLQGLDGKPLPKPYLALTGSGDPLGPVTREECVSHGNFESSASICRKFLFPPFPSCRPRTDQYYGLGGRRGYGLKQIGNLKGSILVSG
jgi:hypothetical protein